MPEHQNIEYKTSWRDEFLKWICGFANAQGGTLYIGRDDNGNIVGVQNAVKLMEDLPNKITSVLGIIADVNLHETEKGDYIEVVVEPQQCSRNTASSELNDLVNKSILQSSAIKGAGSFYYLV